MENFIMIDKIKSQIIIERSFSCVGIII